MAKARALDRRRKSVKNIRKITRTMELIATARFKKAMDRSIASRDYTLRLAKILENIAAASAGGADGEGGGAAASAERRACPQGPRAHGPALPAVAGADRAERGDRRAMHVLPA